MIYNITPVPKPRMTRQDSWPNRPPKYKGKEWPRRCVQRYRNFENLVALNNIDFSEIGAHITFVMPMPKSWSKAKKEIMNNRYHQQKPDLDNLLKAIGDAVYMEDSGIADIHATKLWGYEGQIIITSIKKGLEFCEKCNAPIVETMCCCDCKIYDAMRR